MSGTREQKWQIARGIAILAVVLIHCPNAISAEISSMDFKSWLVLRQLINFPVALFFFMAGRFTNIERYSGYPDFLIKRCVKRLLVPFLIWSTLYGLFGALRSMGNGSSIVFGDLMIKIISGKSAPHLYYVVVLLQLTLLTPLILWLLKKQAYWVILLVEFTWMSYIYYSCYSLGALPSIYHMVFPAWIVFFAAGLRSRTQKTRGIPLCLIGFAIGIEILEAFLSVRMGAPLAFACSQVRLSSFLFAKVVIDYFLNSERTASSWIDRGLVYLGDRSYAIYFIHYLFILVAKPVVGRFRVSFFGISWMFQALLVFVISLTGSIFVVQSVHQIRVRIKNQETPVNSSCS